MAHEQYRRYRKRTLNLPDYDGKSAQEVFTQELAKVAPERRARLLELSQVVGFADKSAEYFQDGGPMTEAVTNAHHSVAGLATEIKVPLDAVLKGTPSFMMAVGVSNPDHGDEPDKVFSAVRDQFGLKARVFDVDQLRNFRSPEQVQRFDLTLAHFETFQIAK